MGLGNDSDHSELQRVSLAPLTTMTPKSIVFGASHTLLLFPDGKVFASGSNESGQCGIQGCPLLKEFTELPGRWAEVAAGWEFSVLRSVEGNIYSCGKGPKGELGLGKDIREAQVPTKIDMEVFTQVSAIKQIKASVNHVIVQLENNAFVGWGACRRGQLGEFLLDVEGTQQKNPLALWAPTQLPFCEAQDYCLGRDRTILLRDKIDIAGRALEFEGLSMSAALDEIELNHETNESKESKESKEGKESKEMKVQCGWSSLHVLQMNHLQGFGKNAHGQIFPSSLIQEPIQDYEVGSEHGVILVKSGQVYAWGWGEHGNCGPGHNDFGITKLLEGRQVVGMKCGLASTWIITKSDDKTSSSP